MLLRGEGRAWNEAREEQESAHRRIVANGAQSATWQATVPASVVRFRIVRASATVVPMRRFAATALVLAAAVVAQDPIQLDYPALLQRMVDVDWLWQPPVPGERCVQWSSFDRASQKGPDDPFAWYANDDRGKYLRVVERDGVKEHVMVDATGPGCIARIWSANPSGTLHFDVDGARVWSVDFAALCTGKVEGVPEPLAGMRSKGGNCYLPIPFAKSLQVSCTAGDLYYLVDVVQFAAGTSVPSFAPSGLPTLAAGKGMVDATARVGPNDTTLWVPTAKATVERGRIVRKVTVLLPKDVTREEQIEIARHCLLVVRCGNEETVRVPLADFFALGSAGAHFVTRCLAVVDDKLTCAFPMPMPAGGSVEILSERDHGWMMPQVDRVQSEALALPDALLFRASYHLVKGTPTRPFTDHLVLDAKGRGRFVGCSLLVRNPSRIWWGEGDEMFTVDGEASPSWWGTGTEDYFGYAWCDPTPFQAPFHAQIQCDGPMNFGFTQLHRTHVLDSVPFQTSFRFELERWHWVPDTTIDYATVAYWYGAAGATAGLPPVPPAADRVLEKLAGPPVFVAEQALEGEELRVLKCDGGTHEVQDIGVYERMFSKDRHRWWRDGKVGEALVLAVPVASAGRYRVTAAFVQADDFGIVQCSLGGERLGEPFDGFHPHVQSTGPRVLGEVDLPAGEAELRLEVVGTNPTAKPRHMVGLDYIRLEAMR